MVYLIFHLFHFLWWGMNGIWNTPYCFTFGFLSIENHIDYIVIKMFIFHSLLKMENGTDGKWITPFVSNIYIYQLFLVSFLSHINQHQIKTKKTKTIRCISFLTYSIFIKRNEWKIKNAVLFYSCWLIPILTILW